MSTAIILAIFLSPFILVGVVIVMVGLADQKRRREQADYILSAGCLPRRGGEELDAAFLNMQRRIALAHQAQTMRVAYEAIERNAKLKADRFEAECQQRQFEALRARNQDGGSVR